MGGGDGAVPRHDGQPGPATWVHGSYPDGQDEFPVSGVSWYEAAAFAKFAGKSLPTIYHWNGASGRLTLAEEIIPRSNLEGPGRRRSGSTGGWAIAAPMTWPATSRSGASTAPATASDTSSAGPGTSRITGSPTRTPGAAIDREKNMGFRCVKYLPGQEPPEKAFEEIKRAARDFLAEKPLSDDEFQTREGPLRLRQERSRSTPSSSPQEETASWVHERWTVDAAYGNERLIMHVFLPKEAAPPYQPVIYWPEPAAFFQRADRRRPRTKTWPFSSRAAGPWSGPSTRGRMSGKSSRRWWANSSGSTRSSKRTI